MLKNWRSTIYQIYQKRNCDLRGKDGIRLSDVSQGTNDNVTVRAGCRRTHWQFRKRERTPRVANRASDCRVLARVAARELGGRREGCCQLEWTAQDLPPRARAWSTPLRFTAVASLYLRRSSLSPSPPRLARVSNNSTTDSSTAPPPLPRNEKTEKSSLSFARRSVSDGSHQGWRGW